MKSYRFLDHTADIACKVTGSSLEELFIASAFAWRESVIEEFIASSNQNGKELNLSEDSCEELLVSFLSELNFLLSTRRWVMNAVNNIKITKTDIGGLHLEAIITGEPLDFEKQTLKEEIKAVTFHQMKIETTSDKYSTIIVFDI